MAHMNAPQLEPQQSAEPINPGNELQPPAQEEVRTSDAAAVTPTQQADTPQKPHRASQRVAIAVGIALLLIAIVFITIYAFKPTWLPAQLKAELSQSQEVPLSDSPVAKAKDQAMISAIGQLGTAIKVCYTDNNQSYRNCQSTSQMVSAGYLPTTLSDDSQEVTIKVSDDGQSVVVWSEMQSTLKYCEDVNNSRTNGDISRRYFVWQATQDRQAGYSAVLCSFAEPTLASSTSSGKETGEQWTARSNALKVSTAAGTCYINQSKATDPCKTQQGLVDQEYLQRIYPDVTLVIFNNGKDQMTWTQLRDNDFDECAKGSGPHKYYVVRSDELGPFVYCGDTPPAI